MANPNIINVATIQGETLTANLTTTFTTTLLSGITDKILKINSIIVSNIDGILPTSFNMYLVEGATTRPFAYQITVPGAASLVLIDRNSGFYLKEGQSIQGGASSTDDLAVLISYDVIS